MPQRVTLNVRQFGLLFKKLMYIYDFLFQEAISNMSGSVGQYLKLIK